MGTMTWWERLRARLSPYLISPIGVPRRPHAIVYAAAHPGGPLLKLNRYPRQVIGIGIRLPDMEPPIGSQRKQPFHLRLSIVWAKPHAASRWH